MTKFPEKSAKITTSGGAMGKYLVFILNSDTHCKVFAEHVVSLQQIEMSVYPVTILYFISYDLLPI